MESVDSAVQALKAQGYKITPKRRDMLTIVQNANRFISASQVYNILKERYNGVSYDTVYRNLYTFVELGILEMSERSGEKVFLMHCSKKKHHHHFVCNNCARITEISMCPMDFFEEQLPGYVISDHTFELTGVCSTCAKNRQVVTSQSTKQNGCACGHHH